jgi:hypothetical protein
MLDDVEGGSGSPVLKAEPQSCCFQHIAVGIALYELKSDLVPVPRNREEEVELEKSAAPTSAQQKR